MLGYAVGSNESGWSDLFYFTTLPEGVDWNPNILIIGDLGNKFAFTLGAIQDDIITNRYHLVVHLGDFAYDLDDDDGRMGDAFFRQIEPIAASVPYQVCPGNHEQAQ